MSQSFNPQFQSRRERIPRELYHELIIPYLLADYVHRYIVHDRQQGWNPFFHLPLVCKHFNRSCKLYTHQIFHADGHDEADTEPPIPPLSLLESTRRLWCKAQELPNRSEYPEPTYGKLESINNLIQIYICAGFAKYLYAIEVLRPVTLEYSRDIIMDDPNITPGITGDPDLEIPSSFRFRMYKMSHDRTHKFYLPFMCAIRLCDSIKYHVLAEPIAEYLAKAAITYGTEPILLERIQELEMNMTKRYNPNLRAQLIQGTLNLIMTCKKFLASITTHGKLVSQYHVYPSDLTKQTIERTHARDILTVVALVNWGSDTKSINRTAASILGEFQEICEREAPRVR